MFYLGLVLQEVRSLYCKWSKPNPDTNPNPNRNPNPNHNAYPNPNPN